MTGTTKKARIAAIDAEMAEADFWNNQERAQADRRRTQVARRRSSSRSTTSLKSSDDLAAMIEMADEDESFAAEVPGEVDRLEAESSRSSSSKRCSTAGTTRPARS